MDAYSHKIPHVMRRLFTSKWKLNFMAHGDAWYNNFLFRYFFFFCGPPEVPRCRNSNGMVRPLRRITP
jgi:hypothetical protein